MAGGRPTDYDPSFCDKVVEWGSLGKSRAWIAAELGIVKQTLINWENAHPEFLDSMARAKLLEQRWWEEAGQTNLTTQGYQASMWSRSMAARFPDDWRERSDVNHGAADGFAALLGKLTTSVFPKNDETPEG